MIKRIIDWLKKTPSKYENDWTPFVYSEMIKRFPIHGKVGDDDIIMVSHKTENGYETCYVHISDILEYINSKNKSNLNQNNEERI